MKMQNSLIFFVTFIAGIVVALGVPVFAQQSDSDSLWGIAISRPAETNINSSVVHIVKFNKTTGQTMVLSCISFCTKKSNWLELPTNVVK